MGLSGEVILNVLQACIFITFNLQVILLFINNVYDHAVMARKGPLCSKGTV